MTMAPPSSDELDEFIEDPLADKLAVIRKIRARMRSRSRVLAVIVAVFGLPTTVAVTQWYATDTASMVWIPAATVIGWIAVYAGIWYRHIAEEIPFEYRDDIVVPLVHFVDPRLKYHTDGEISEAELVASAFFGEEIAECAGEDLFEGQIGSIEVRFADVEVTGSDRNFEGLFFIAGFPGHTGEVDVEKLEKELGERFESAVVDDRFFAMRPASGYFDRNEDAAIDDTGHLHRIGGELSALIGAAERIAGSG